MKSVAILLLSALGMASAFVPQQQQSATTALAASFEGELGAQKPLGYWYVEKYVYRYAFVLVLRARKPNAQR